MTKERNERFKRICQRAREMWESEGRPMNKHEWFWAAAMAEIDGTELRTQDRLVVDEPSLLSRTISAMDNLIEIREGGTSVPERLSSKSVKMHSSRL